MTKETDAIGIHEEHIALLLMMTDNLCTLRPDQTPIVLLLAAVLTGLSMQKVDDPKDYIRRLTNMLLNDDMVERVAAKIINEHRPDHGHKPGNA